jgi:hypothetical protein
MIDLDSPEEFLQRRMRSVDRRRLLQPRTPNQILDLSTRLYHRLAWPILRLTLPSMVLLYAGLVFFQGFVLPGLLTTSDPDSISVQFGEVMTVYAVALFVALPVVVIALGHTVGLTTRLIADYMLEQRSDLDAAVRSARAGAMTMVGLLTHIFLRSGVVLMVSGGFMMGSAYADHAGYNTAVADLATFFAVVGLVVGFIMVPIVMSRLCLAPAVASVEGVRPQMALKRSRTLMAKSRHISSGYDTLLNLWVVSIFVALVLWLGFYGAFGMSGLSDLIQGLSGRSILWSVFAETLMTLPTFLAVWLLVPFMTCCVTVLYFDRRVKLEALDIEVMAHDVLKGTQEADLRL